MRQHHLGKTDIVVSVVGQGCALFSEGYRTPNDEESLRALATAADAGITFFDTSDAYGMGHNEQLLGRFLKHRRDAIVATKIGLARRPGVPPAINNSPEYIRSACEASLQRLGVERLDLCYLQRRDASVPIEDVIGTLSALVKTSTSARPSTLRRTPWSTAW